MRLCIAATLLVVTAGTVAAQRGGTPPAPKAMAPFDPAGYWVALVSDVEPSLTLQADQVRLQQIVSNLLTNAVKFTPQGGRVTITARRHGHRLQITVSDTGEGIDPEMSTTIFEPFQSLAGQCRCLVVT